jgi:Xaa-Pro aminopeptidase
MNQRASVAEIQKAVEKAGLDGWLFYDFRHSDPMAYRILGLDQGRLGTRRWFYFIPSSGTPTKIVHTIERDHLDSLPGEKLVYLPWQDLHDCLRRTLTGRKRIAMQYSPQNDIPYVSRVDAGTIELVRSFGCEIVSSADLVQQFEATWSDDQLASHLWAAPRMRRIVDETFAEIARRVREEGETSELDVQRFIASRFDHYRLVADHPPIVAVNAHSANPHYTPTVETSEPIRAGDFVLIDLWAKQKECPRSVYVDITWTGFVGREVPEPYRAIFDIVRRARDRAIELVREAVSAGRSLHGWEVDEACRKVIIEAGYGEFFLHRTGHSIGEDVHGNGANMDNLETRDNRIIIPRTCFSIEPGIYLEGRFGIRSEVDVYVGEKDVLVSPSDVQTEVIPILRDAG